MSAEPITRIVPADTAAIADAAGVLARRRARGIPDRDRLRPRRRCHRRQGRRAALCGQGTARFQSADRSCRRHRSRAKAGGVQRSGGASCRRVLAGTAHIGPAQACGLSGRRPCDRGARQHRGPHARPSGGARSAACAGQAGGRAVRQSLRPCLSDHRGACAERSRRPDRSHPRRRTDIGRHRVDHRCVPRPPDAAAPRRLGARSDRKRARFAAGRCAAGQNPTRRSRPACWHRTTRRAPACG